MSILRIILIGLTIWVAWILYRRFIQKKNSIPNKNVKDKVEIKTIRQCAVCGVHIPESDTWQKNNRFYCCKAHLDQDSA